MTQRQAPVHGLERKEGPVPTQSQGFRKKARLVIPRHTDVVGPGDTSWVRSLASPGNAFSRRKRGRHGHSPKEPSSSKRRLNVAVVETDISGLSARKDAGGLVTFLQGSPHLIPPGFAF